MLSSRAWERMGLSARASAKGFSRATTLVLERTGLVYLGYRYTINLHQNLC